MLKNVKKGLLSIMTTAAILVSCMPVLTTAAESDYSDLFGSPAVKPSVGGALKIDDKNVNPIQLTKIADVRYHMDPKSLKYYDGNK
jgi:hypothetical protein